MEYRLDEENKKDLEYTPLFPAHTNQSADRAFLYYMTSFLNWL